MNKMGELILKNYCHPDCKPLMNIMRLNKEDAFSLAYEMAKKHPDTQAFYRFADFENYYSLRCRQDEFLYKRFIELGGKPEETHPLSFTIGDSEYLKEWFGNGIETRLTLDGISQDHISFTIGDSGAIIQNEGTVDVLALSDLEAQLEEYDYDVLKFLEKHNRKYIEVQLWSDRYISNCRLETIVETPLLETDRLILRQICKEDVEEIFSCWMSDIEVSKYMWWKASDDIKDVEEFVDFEINQINNNKWFRWIIQSKETMKIVGTCLIYWNDEDTDPHWDISYNLGRKYWGSGFVTEAMREVLDFSHNDLGVNEIITSYAKENEASANVLKKLGFVSIKEIPYECSGGEFVTEGICCRYVFE